MQERQAQQWLCLRQRPPGMQPLRPRPPTSIPQGVTRMSLLAHSYGTLVASALTKLAAASARAPAISRLTLVDPVW